MDIVNHVAEALNDRYKKVFNVELAVNIARKFANTAIQAVAYHHATNTSESEYKLIQAFGYSGSEILKALKGYYGENKQMTREEALHKLNLVDLTDRPISANERNYVLLKKLEALGLIKFEEEKKDELADTLKSLKIEHRIVGDLFSKGYAIYKVGVDYSKQYEEEKRNIIKDIIQEAIKDVTNGTGYTEACYILDKLHSSGFMIIKKGEN